MINQTRKLLLVVAVLLSVPVLVPSPTQAQSPSRVVTPEAKFEVVSCVANVSSNPTTVIEIPNHLRYITSYFTTNATVRCTTPMADSYTIGFIQQVDFINLRMDYPRAYSSWEVPNLPINDSSGADLPWIHNNDERQIVEAGATNWDVEVVTDDNFDVTVGLQEPLPPDGKRGNGKLELQHIKRDQRFTVWLAAKRLSDGKITILKKITWRMEVDISVNPNQPFGLRTKLNPVTTHRLIIVDARDLKPTEKIPPQVLNLPRANEAQQFWWTPKLKDIGARTQLK
ncbi:MAG TPA: hypothetical protein VGB77_09895 [Abditibacteriaceae bacterium]|jgi:hypothetical protein